MHKNSMTLMEMMFDKYHPEPGNGRLLYDVGSYDVNGSYRAMCEKRGWKYVGLDIAEGPNVDVVVSILGKWAEDLSPAHLVISGQCIEHVEYPWNWIRDVQRLISNKGYLFLIAPAMWPEHKHPKDCYRYLPDGFKALAKWAELDYIEGGLSYAQKVQNRDGEDCWGVLRKP